MTLFSTLIERRYGRLPMNRRVLHPAATAPARRTISKARAGDDSAGTAPTSRPISYTGSGRQIERAHAGDIGNFVGPAFATRSIGIAETTRLNFMCGSVDCGFGQT